MLVERLVYNLEFRPWSTRLEIGDYTFERVPNYAEQHRKLQHLVNTTGSEFSESINTGEHAHTANVTGPDDEPQAVIPWQHHKPIALHDILLLLRLFTRRDVFALEPTLQEADDFAILADSRLFTWGAVLVCSIPFERESTDGPYRFRDVSLQVHLPRIYGRMHDP